MTYPMGRPIGPLWAQKSVAVFGAGVGGMTAAHELAERGFKVDLYELGTRVGGKAATQTTSFVDVGGNLHDAAAEHGFRLFPAFYRHVIDTMSRIPFDRKTAAFSGAPDDIPPVGSPVPRLPRSYASVAEGLIATTEAGLAARGFEIRDVPRAGAGTVEGFLGFVESWFGMSAVTPDLWTRDLARFQLKLLQYLTSSEPRRQALDSTTWLDFISGGIANVYTPAFQRMVETFIRTMVAMDARHGSAYTVGRVAMQMLLDVVGDGATTDRVLDGPTSQQWLTPWMSHLRRLGVTIHGGAGLQSVTVSGGRIQKATVAVGLAPITVDADYFVLALPAPTVRTILQNAGVTPNTAPSLAWVVGTAPIDPAFAWLSGAQFYLRSDVPMVRGHVYFPDAPWGLSAVAQGQFWGGGFDDDYGDREFRGVLSVDIADWDTPGQFDAAGVSARDAASSDVIALEVYHQLADALSSSGAARLADDDLYGWHLDDSILTPDRGAAPTRNLAPHFVHPAGSRRLRPPAAIPEIANLMLAADYVRTETDLACMEGACEAGRLAANAVLIAASSPAAPAATYRLVEPPIVDGLKAIDGRLVTNGDPHMFDILGLEAWVNAAPSVSIGALRTIAGSQSVGQLVANVLATIPTITF